MWWYRTLLLPYKEKLGTLDLPKGDIISVSLFNTIEREVIELVGAQIAPLLYEAEALKHRKRGMI